MLHLDGVAGYLDDIAAQTVTQIFIYGHGGNDTINLAAISSATFSTLSYVELHGDAGNDTIFGSQLADIIEGGQGDDILQGNAGNDTYLFKGSSSWGTGNQGNDTLLEAPLGDVDTLDFTELGTAISISLTIGYPGFGGTQTVADSNGVFLALNLSQAAENLENVIGSPYDDVIWGNAQDNYLQGRGGYDVLVGLGNQADYVSGGITSVAGDRLTGGSGNDELYGDGHVMPGWGTNGDFDDNAVVDAADIDILWHIVRGFGSDPGDNDTPDLNFDGYINEDDVDYLLAGLLTAGPNRRYGDADLSGGVPELNDYYAWAQGTSGWAEGDFDGSGGVPTLADRDLWFSGPAVFPYSVGPHAPVGVLGSDYLAGESGDDRLEGGPGDDQLGGGFDNDLYVFAGSQTLGSDRFSELGGVDTLDFSGLNFGTGIVVDLSVSSSDYVTVISTGGKSLSLKRNAFNQLENILGTDYDDILIGNDLDNQLHGLGGNDTLIGMGNATDFNGITGGDRLYGSDGEDHLYGDHDEITLPNAGGDFLDGGDGDDELRAGAGNNWLYGGAGYDGLDAESGNDRLEGGPGSDYLGGGSGNDTYLFAGTASLDSDTIGDSSGIDTLDFSNLDFGAGINVDLTATWWVVIDFNGKFLGLYTIYPNQIENVIGTTYSDILTGNALNNHLIGGDGDDTLNGQEGDDTLEGNADADTLSGGEGNDTLFGGDDNDTLSGDEGDDSLHGDDGEDSLWDDSGTNTFDGGLGDDTFNGDVTPQLLLGGSGTVDEGAVYSMQLISLTPGVVGWFIDWGDGASQSVEGGGQTIQHVYADDTSRTISAIGIDEDGSYIASPKEIEIQNVDPTLTISGAAAAIEGSPYVLHLDSFDPGGDTITSWFINWGDGSTQTVQSNPVTVNHTFAAGSVQRTIAATATDEDGTHNANSLNVIANALAAPVLVSAQVLSSTQVKLTWQHASSYEQGYRLEASTNGTTFTQYGAAGANVLTQTISGLSAGVSYLFRVVAYNAVSSANSNALSANGVLIGFEGYAAGTPITNQYAEATFSTIPGRFNEVYVGYGGSGSNSIGVRPLAGEPWNWNKPLYVDFTNPVWNLKFHVGADDTSAVIAQVRVYTDGQLAATQNIMGDSNPTALQIIDLSTYQSVTRIEIDNINDPAGLLWDDFAFTVSPVPALKTPANQQSAEGDTISLQIELQDPSVSSSGYTFEATGLPDDLEIDATTGQITGKLGFLAFDNQPGGGYSVTVNLKDGSGKIVSSVSFKWNVFDAYIDQLSAFEVHDSALTSNFVVATGLTFTDIYVSPGNKVKLIAGFVAHLPVDSADILWSVTGGESGDFSTDPVITPFASVTTNVFVGLDMDQNGTLDPSERTHSLTLHVINLTSVRFAARRTSGPVESTHYTIKQGEHFEVGGTFEFIATANAGTGTVLGTPSLIRWQVYGQTATFPVLIASGSGSTFSYTMPSEGDLFVQVYADANDNHQWDSGEVSSNYSATFFVKNVTTRSITIDVSDKLNTTLSQEIVEGFVDNVNDLLLMRNSETDYRAAVRFEVTGFNFFTSDASGGLRPDPVDTLADLQRHFDAPAYVVIVDFINLVDAQGRPLLGATNNYDLQQIVIGFFNATVIGGSFEHTLAHELGHGVGLPHLNEPRNLMRDEADPSAIELNLDQAASFEGPGF